MKKDKKIFPITVKSGFTLPEVLVVIFIMVLGIGITLASFSDTKPIDEVEAATRHLAALVREAQNNSLSGKQQVESGSLVATCLNGIEWGGNVSSGIDFILYSHKSSDCGPSGKIVSRTETMKKVTLEGAAGGASVFFSVPSGKIGTSGFPFIGGLANSAQLKIQSTVKPSVFSLVCVYPNGRVEEVFGSASCP